MMKRTLPLALVALLPGMALALDFENIADRYEDAPFSRAETAGISVLTEIGAVSGNPDGTFAAGRTLNRAEFTKIALLAGRMEQGGSDCFPDVVGQWFAPYVCAAKEQGVVQGNPDGMFHPERAVNYAEATKILVEMFDYELPTIKTGTDVAWYTPYLLAAKDNGVALPGDIAPAHELTRGQMARLAAAFVAKSEGELDAYRAFERGEAVSSASSSVSSSTSSVPSSTSSSSSLSSSSSSSSSVSSSTLFPAYGRFLVAGTTTPVLFDGAFRASDAEDEVIRQVAVELRREVKGIEALQLIDGAGTVIATLELDDDSDDDNEWIADLETGSYVLPKNQSVRLGIRAIVKAPGSGGTSNELVQLQSMSVRARGVTSAVSRQIVPVDTHEPVHQTAFGKVVSVENNLGSALTLSQGTAKLLGTFTVGGKAASGSSVWLESLSFALQTTDVSVSNLKIGGTSPAQRGDCATEQVNDGVWLTCFVPEDMKNVTASSVTLNVYGDLSVSASKQSGMVHLSSLGTGGVGSTGSVRWSDVSHSFNWIEGDAHLESGPIVTVTK